MPIPAKLDSFRQKDIQVVLATLEKLARVYGFRTVIVLYGHRLAGFDQKRLGVWINNTGTISGFTVG